MTRIVGNLFRIALWGLGGFSLAVASGCGDYLPAGGNRTVDLAVTTDVLRVHGSVGTGAYGVPVAGAGDVDGDGRLDLAIASMTAEAAGRRSAGQVFLVFGEGRTQGTLDTAEPAGRILTVLGASVAENAGSEIWIDDVTGDRRADLLIARQNHSPDPARKGAGALSIVVGGPALRARAEAGLPLDLAAPGEIEVITLVGAHALGRFGMWVRTGDVDGDGIADLAVGADSEPAGERVHVGAVYLVRGGSALVAAGRIDLAEELPGAMVGKVTRLVMGDLPDHAHFGATCALFDLDGDGRAEILAAAALNRMGAALLPAGVRAADVHATGGLPGGQLFVAWSDALPVGPWGLQIDLGELPGTTRVAGGPGNITLAEELLGGGDYDDDGRPDLFVGDISADLSVDGARSGSGGGHVFWDAMSLKGRSFGMASPPPDVDFTTLIGAAQDNLTGDTAAHGDFDGDGVLDLMISAPHADARGRIDNGMLHILHGRTGGWPARVDLRHGRQPPPDALAITEVLGAAGNTAVDTGDTLGYSATAADYDGDGVADLVVNEMTGNGVKTDAVDVGNLLLISGDVLTATERGSIHMAPAGRGL